VSDFEVLERLAESDERKFRAHDLAETVHLSQSALSRLVDRLARHGLVERCGCEGDRRGIYVMLTEAGEQRHGEAAPTHRSVLARTLPPAMMIMANNQPR
jgi:DNA-binding MarR family transcriptional regulator